MEGDRDEWARSGCWERAWWLAGVPDIGARSSECQSTSAATQTAAVALVDGALRTGPTQLSRGRERGKEEFIRWPGVVGVQPDGGGARSGSWAHWVGVRALGFGTSAGSLLGA